MISRRHNNSRTFSLPQSSGSSCLHQQQVSWLQVLTESRAFRREEQQRQQQQCSGHLTTTTSTPHHNEFVDTFGPYFPLLVDQLQAYISRLNADAVQVVPTTSSSTEEEKESMTKQMILDTRNALRFGLSCLSFASDDDEPNNDEQKDIAITTRQTVQNKAIAHDWHVYLARLLCHSSKKSNNDVKCRLYAARLLTNLVTNNAASARAVVASIPLTPSQDSISSRIRQDVLQADMDGDQQKESPSSSQNNNTPSNSNWLDMLLVSVRCCSKDRNVLAAVVAALHNCIASLVVDDDDDDDDDDDSSETNDNDEPFHQQVARNSLIVSTLLRQVISAKSMIPNGAAAEVPEENGDTTTTPSSSSSHADTATEWILMLLLQLVRLGLLPQLYSAAAGGGRHNVGDSTNHETAPTTTVTTTNVLVPEQVVLLHCLIKGIADEQQQSTTAASSSGGGDLMVSIFGGNPDHAIAAHLFLSRVFVDVRYHRCLSASGISGDASHNWWTTSTANDDDGQEDCTAALERSTLLTILDIMGETLGDDTPFTCEVRNSLASRPQAAAVIPSSVKTTTTLLETILLDLGQIVDELLVRNQATTTSATTTVPSSVRNFVMLESEQRVMTSLVRVIGNLCFQCRQHQDLMRTTLVPSRMSSTTTATATASTTTPRTGLHVLLSSTSFAHACFTLREWSIVAIRNVLHENFDNQAVVAELEAQQPIQSPTLESLGIRLDLESNNNRRQQASSSRSGSNQRVSVEPIQEEEHDRNEEQKDNTADKA